MVKIMTKLIFKYNHLMIQAAYKTPEPHSHLAAHLIISLKGMLSCCVEAEMFQAKGICIASDVEHTVYSEEGEILLFLFIEASSYVKELEEVYLKGKVYMVIPEELVQKICALWEQYEDNFEILDVEILRACGMKIEDYDIYEERVQKVLDIIKSMETIETNVMEKLCRDVFLSKSRLSHLFKQETGISLKRYLALEKMRKAYQYFGKTENITEACLRAGFDSASHYAATCKKMFGISFTEFVKSKK